MRKAYFRLAGAILPCLLMLSLIPAWCETSAAQERARKEPPTPGPMLAQGRITLDTPEFTLDLVRSSQTVAGLKPKAAPAFDFTPGDLIVERSKDGYYHLGDLNLRVRIGSSDEWKNYSTAVVRQPVIALPAAGAVLAAADLSPTLPADIPLQISRTWALEEGKLVLRFALKNKTRESVQVGALGIPMVFNNVLNDRSLEEAHAKCSFYDPYIGEDAGYLQVTRLNGHGPALLVLPDGQTPFEAYAPILSQGRTRGKDPGPIFTDPTPRWVTFEGFYDWMVHTKAFSENGWNSARQWNPPTSLTLAPGESKMYGLKFVVADSIRGIEQTLTENHRPVAIGIPGYVLPMDIDAQLFLKYAKGIKSLVVEPGGAITIGKRDVPSLGWKAYELKGNSWGRARLTITYEDGLVQTIQYFVVKPAAEAVANMGSFLTTKQWFVDPQDPFHRSPSFMTYDREENKIVMQDSRAWIAGLGDEGGGGAWISAIMKQLGAPNQDELNKFQQFVDGVLWGGLQYKDGPKKFGVRKSLFYYQPDQMPQGYYRKDFDWTSWTSWNRADSERVDRSYDYPHVVAADWVLYRLARNYDGLVTNHPWDWYLTNAYETSVAMVKLAPGYAVFGQMEGDIFLQVLEDLRREGWNAQADDLEAKMRVRANRWKEEAYPYGSEMPWDSTGQEEVYAWMKHFGFQEKAEVTLNAILGYDPAIPHWGYNGSARRYWDFIFAGKLRQLERQLHHYGSSLNAIPLLAEFREHPGDFYLLRVGYAGAMGTLTDIDQEGFLAPAFHAFPDLLRPDGITGDDGTNLFGHAWNTATYIVHHPDFGWVAFGGNIRVEGETVKVTPLDSFRMRMYLASTGLWLTLDAGQFEALELDEKTGAIRVGLTPATQYLRVARLRIEQAGKIEGAKTYQPVKSWKQERGAYVVPLRTATTWVELTH